MDNIQTRFTPVEVKINNDDTLLHNWLAEILLKVALKHQKSKSNHDSDVETTDM
jgi:hypothetical protein